MNTKFILKRLNIFYFIILFITSVAFMERQALGQDDPQFGGVTHGGGNFRIVEGKARLFDDEQYNTAVPMELEKEAFWADLTKMLNYLDAEFPGFIMLASNSSQVQRWLTPYWGNYSPYLFYDFAWDILREEQAKSLSGEFFDSKTHFKNFMPWNGLGSQLRAVIKERKWYIESKALRELGCLNQSLTDSPNFKVGACQDDFEVRVSADFLAASKEDTWTQAGLLLHELLRIYFKPVILNHVNGGADKNYSNQVLSNYGIELLDKVTAVVVHLTKAKQGRVAILNAIQSRLKNLTIGYLTKEGATEFKSIFAIQNKEFCNYENQPSVDQDIINANIIKALGKTMAPHKIWISKINTTPSNSESVSTGSGNATPDFKFVGKPKDIFNYFNKTGWPTIFIPLLSESPGFLRYRERADLFSRSLVDTQEAFEISSATAETLEASGIKTQGFVEIPVSNPIGKFWPKYTTYEGFTLKDRCEFLRKNHLFEAADL